MAFRAEQLVNEPPRGLSAARAKVRGSIARDKAISAATHAEAADLTLAAHKYRAAVVLPDEANAEVAEQEGSLR